LKASLNKPRIKVCKTIYSGLKYVTSYIANQKELKYGKTGWTTLRGCRMDTQTLSSELTHWKMSKC